MTRLHPVSVVYRAGSSVARLAWIVVLVSFGSTTLAGGGALLAAAVVAVAVVGAAAYQVAYHRRFDYELSGDTLDIRSGVLSRRTREIPLERVQNVDISRNVVQRLLGIAQVDVETAGGGSTEASLRFVGADEADRLQAEIGRLKRRGDLEAPQAGADAGDRREEIYHITPTELGLYGLTSVDLRLLGLLSVGSPILAPAIFGGRDPLVALALGAPVVLALLVGAAAVASAAIAVTRYYGFRLSQVGEELRYERGLFERYSGTIPLEKVQTVVLSESVLARRVGYATLSVKTAGYAPGEGGQQSAIPLAERDRVLAFARSVRSFDEPTFERPPRRARTRYVIRYSLAVGVLVVAAWAVVAYTRLTGPWYAAAALFVLVPVAAHLKWANLGYQLQDDCVVAREGFWTRHTRVVPYDRLQTVVDGRTVFQRRRHLATVIADTAGTGGSGGDARLLDIDDRRADEVREDLARRLQAALRA